MENNMQLYNLVREVPECAKKPITAGRLKGKTDINPMWRIKVLTENFGICGIGWKTVIDRTWLDIGGNGEQTASVQISLYVRDPETKEWSDAIVGIGGAMYITNEKGGAYTDDECYKKAYTDAISVACKALGIGADVYFDKDSTKYDARPSTPARSEKTAPVAAPKAEAPKVSPEELELRRQWAKTYEVTEGPMRGSTIAWLFKNDRAKFDELRANPPSEECAAAIQILIDWIMEGR